MAKLTDPIFQDAGKARELLEATLWPNGPVCPHCGGVDEATELKGKAHRAGLYQCNTCREQFTATVGTVAESSKLPLNKWLLATHLLATDEGASTRQLHIKLGVTYKTAHFLAQRIRNVLARPTNTAERIRDVMSGPDTAQAPDAKT